MQLYWTSQGDLLKDLNLSCHKKRKRKSVICEADKGTIEPSAMLEQVKSWASNDSCKALFNAGQFSSSKIDRLADFDEAFAGTKEGQMRQKAVASWGQDAKVFQDFDVQDDCYVIDVRNTDKGQRFVKVENKEQNIELPPEENPNIADIEKMTKHSLNGQASAIVSKKTTEQDHIAASEEPIDLDVGNDKAADFA